MPLQVMSDAGSRDDLVAFLKQATQASDEPKRRD